MRYSKRTAAAGPNRHLLPDGRLVETKTTLYTPVVVSEHLETKFDDWPARRESFRLGS